MADFDSLQPTGQTRSAELSLKGWSITRTWEAVTSSPTTDEVDVVASFMGAQGITVGAVDTETGSEIQKVTADCNNDDGLSWTITVSYAPSEGSTGGEANPLQQPAQVSGSFSKQTRSVDYDTTGKPIVNSVGMPFQEAVEIDDSRSVVEVSKNVPSVPISLYSYRDAVNGTPFLGASAGTVKCAGASWDGPHNYTQNNITIQYWSLKVSFEFRADGWSRYVLDQGLYEVKSGARSPILVNGQQVTDPVLLDGAGHQLPQGGKPYWHEYKVYPVLPYFFFSQLLGV